VVRLRQPQCFQPDMAPPVISVVIPTRDRCAVLRSTLEALNRQKEVSGRYEVIVVDDGSSDDTATMLSGARFSNFELKALSVEHGGPARARNRGIAKASAARVLLLGDDTIPVSTNLKIHLEQSGEQEIGVQGAIEWDPEVGINDVMRFLAPEGPQFWFKGLVDGSQVSWESQVSSNLSAPRRWFLEEPFDEEFTEACFEDTEMAWRWARRGWIAVFSRSALCLHRHRYDAIEPFLRRQRRAGWWARRAVRRHPGLLGGTVAKPMVVLPLIALRAGVRKLSGQWRKEDLWHLQCRLEFLWGFFLGA
jgi:glycosyltransferase involved in cell wall biosynthesis